LHTYVYFNAAKISKQIVSFAFLLSRNVSLEIPPMDLCSYFLCPLVLSSSSSYPLSKATCFRRAKSMKSRAIPMHNFLLRYFPAYGTRMFPSVALLAICAHIPASAYVYVQACPDAIERVETPRNERTNERGKIVDSMGLMTPCSTKRLPSALSHDRNSFCRLNNLET